jgi:hypothetical protein
VGHLGSEPVGLLNDGYYCTCQGTSVVPKVLTRMCKPTKNGLKASIDHMELSFDCNINAYYVCIFIVHCILIPTCYQLPQTTIRFKLENILLNHEFTNI